MKTAQLDELEYEPEFETEEEDTELEPQSYIFDPDMKTDETDEYIEYDPARRKRRRKPTRRRRRYTPRVVYRYLKKKVKRRVTKKTIWRTLGKLWIPTGILIGFMSDAWGRGADTFPFLMRRIKGWKIPNINFVVDHLINSPPYRNPLIFGGILAFGGYLLKTISPFRGSVKMGRIISKIGIGTIIGTIIASFILLPAIQEHHSNNPNGISEREAYSHVLRKDPFNSTYA